MSDHNLNTEMTKNLVTIASSEKLEKAYELMFSNKIRHLPVTNKEETIIGLISDRDIQRAMQSEVGDSYGFKTEKISFKSEVKVADYMVWPVKSFDVSMDLKDVIRTMVDTKVSSVLVKQNDEVVGIITTEDMLLLLHQLLDESESGKDFKLSEVLSLPLFRRAAQALSDAGI